MKILLFGKNGQLGWELCRTLAPLGELIALGREHLDLQDVTALQGLLREQHPEVIINAAAYTAVDRAEQEPELAFQINARAPGIMATSAHELNATLIHFSTDYVFDGELGRPYVEDDAPNPLNVYGESKLAGERAIQQVGGAHVIFRTAWVYSLRGENFVTKVMSWARTKPELHVVNDQVSNPTWARMLAETIGLLLAQAGKDWMRGHAGLYHLAGSGHASRFEWAQRILAADPSRKEHMARSVQPARSAEFPAAARRPAFSALDCSRFEGTFGLRLPAWERSLELAMG